MIAFALGVGSALLWGLSDFTGGLQARRWPLVAVLFYSQLTGLAGITLIVLAGGRHAPALADLLPALGGGAAGTVALGAFYHALAIGKMSVVAPVSAVGAVVPVLVGVASGDQPSVAQAGGMFAALLGVVLVSREAPDAAGPGVTERSVGLALLAALGFGTFFVGMHASAEHDVLWALLAARVSSVSLLLALIAVRRPPLRVSRLGLAPLVLIGALDLGANALYAIASTKGLLSLVSVLGSLYPVATVVLARAVLGERVRRVQELGIVAAMAGVVLIAAG